MHTFVFIIFVAKLTNSWLYGRICWKIFAMNMPSGGSEEWNCPIKNSWNFSLTLIFTTEDLVSLFMYHTHIFIRRYTYSYIPAVLCAYCNSIWMSDGSYNLIMYRVYMHTFYVISSVTLSQCQNLQNRLRMKQFWSKDRLVIWGVAYSFLPSCDFAINWLNSQIVAKPFFKNSLYQDFRFHFKLNCLKLIRYTLDGKVVTNHCFNAIFPLV